MEGDEGELEAWDAGIESTALINPHKTKTKYVSGFGAMYGVFFLIFFVFCVSVTHYDMSMLAIFCFFFAYTHIQRHNISFI